MVRVVEGVAVVAARPGVHRHAGLPVREVDRPPVLGHVDETRGRLTGGTAVRDGGTTVIWEVNSPGIPGRSPAGQHRGRPPDQPTGPGRGITLRCAEVPV